MEDQQVDDPNAIELAFPPIDSSFFSDDFNLPDNFISDLDGADIDDDFDFIFNDLYLPFDTEEFLNSLPLPVDSDPLTLDSNEFDPNSGDQTSDGAILYNNPSLVTSFQVPGDQSPCLSKLLNLSSPESSLKSGNKHSQATRVLDYPSSEFETHKGCVSETTSSQGSGNYEPNVCETLNYPSPVPGNFVLSAASSPNCRNESIVKIVDPKINLKGATNCLLKRKTRTGDLNSELSMNKFRRSHGIANSKLPNDLSGVINDDDEKKNVRLIRNRESAQLSRQRKKQYVEVLEDKVRNMDLTIQDLRTKISYIMAENASLRQQMNGGAMFPPPVAPHGMYPHPSMAHMGYPWAPYPPYFMKPHGSQVPLVPIPRLKSQQPASVPKTKKSDLKKTMTKSKKVASVSFLGLLFFILLFGVLVPMVKLMFDGTNDTAYGESYYPGRGLDVNGQVKGSPSGMVSRHKLVERVNGKAGHCGRGQLNNEPKEEALSDSGLPSNSSDPLSAYLYVPRNDKFVKIDGNLIIHSVMASEKAMAHSRDDGKRRGGEETGLAVAGNVHAAISHTHSGRNVGLNPRYYRTFPENHMTLGSVTGEKGQLKPKPADGKLQQWFKEGLSGPLLSSGMCKEVFQFDVSPGPGAMVPVSSVVKNSSTGNDQNTTTQFAKGQNRRILHSLRPIPLPGTNNINNITKEPPMGINPKKDSFHSNNSNTSMVVSVLVDPREASDVDGEGVMRGTPKALSRIFVVVLVDSVKYVTYSCILPFKGL